MHDCTEAESVSTAVISAISAASPDRSVEVTPVTEVLGIVDSLGLLTALMDIQHELQLALDAEDVIEVFGSRTIAEIVAVLRSAMSRKAPANGC